MVGVRDRRRLRTWTMIIGRRRIKGKSLAQLCDFIERKIARNSYRIEGVVSSVFTNFRRIHDTIGAKVEV